MSGSQTLLSLGSLTLLSFLTLAANRAILTSYSNMLQTQAMIAAITQAENILEEIESKKFDNAFVEQQTGEQRGPRRRRMPPGLAKKPSDFTPPGLLGKEQGERYPWLNDVDDYNGLQISTWNPVFHDSLSVRISVYYVDPRQPVEPTTTQTTAKKVEVHVYAPAMQDTLKVQRVIYQ